MFFNTVDFLKVSEKAALAVYPFIGKLNKYKADEHATSAMRKELNSMNISAQVIIGEGEMDEAPMLYIGEKLGLGGIGIDIAVDPLDGTTLTSKGQDNAITVIALSDSHSFLNAPDMYMKKIASGKLLKGFLDINKSLTENIKIYIQKTGKKPEDVVVAMLDRPRHKEYMNEVCALGCRNLLLSDGDILPAILTGIDNMGIDILYGIGAAPEGVISAAALKVLGGDFQGILLPQNDEEKQRCYNLGIKDPKNTIFTIDDLVKSSNIQVVISAVTNGFIGEGIKIQNHHYIINSLKIQSQTPHLQFVKSIYKV